MKKLLVVVVIVLFLGLAIAPSINAMFDSKTSDLNEKSGENATVHLGSAQADFYRISINGFFVLGWHTHGHSSGITLEFDANLSEVNIKVIMDYTATMNYTAGPPIVLLTPFVAFGLKENNYTGYSWEYFKLKHENGLYEKKGNVSINITFDMSNIKKGDTIILYPTRTIITDPFLKKSAINPKFPKMTSPLLRFAYLFPRLHETLLEPLILLFYAKFRSEECAWIVVNFV